MIFGDVQHLLPYFRFCAERFLGWLDTIPTYSSHSFRAAVLQGSWMMLPTLIVFTLLCVSTALSLVPQPAQLLSGDLPAPLQLPNVSLPIISNTSSVPSSLPSLSSDLSALMLQCDAEKYGNDLNYYSCSDAYDQIPHYLEVVSFGPRTQGKWTFHLPVRIYSSEWERHPKDTPSIRLRS